jgi:hypothetical protein
LSIDARFVLLVAMAVSATASAQVAPSTIGSADQPSDAASSRDVMNRVIDQVKLSEHEQNLYERIERVETRKSSADGEPQSVKVSRVVPAGTGTAKIPLGADGKPTDPESYRADLQKVLQSLLWAAESGQPQRDAYQKVQKKWKERDEAIEATRNAFIFTFLGQELRDGRTMTKYHMAPNPTFKPTNRTTSIYPKVRGVVWVDDASHQLARVQVEVTEDISLGLFLAKVYKGSHFYQERYEISPGVWLPTFLQFDFDGRKFFSNFSVHEKTFYSSYKRIGPPAEAIPQIQAELASLNSPKMNQSINR